MVRKRILSDKKHNKKIRKVKNINMNFNGIKMKLLGGFLIPVSFIILLGIVSYNKASNEIINSYITASKTSLNMLSDYYNLSLQAVMSKAIQINMNDSIKNYFDGYYKNDELEELAQYKDAQRLVNSTVAADQIVKNVFIFGEYGDGISSYGPMKSSVYNDFIESDEGKQLADMGEYYWGGYHNYLDEVALLKAQDYGLVFYRRLFNSANNPMGYIVFDVRMDFIKQALENVNFSEDSVTGFISHDGREIIVGKYSDGFAFSNEGLVEDAMLSQDQLGSRYVDIEGQTYLYMYSKIDKGNAVVCSLISKDTITDQVKGVKIATIVVVLMASTIAIIIATIMSYGISQTIDKINVALHKVSNGDLTIQVRTKRKDEFLVLYSGFTNMISSMKSLINKVTGVSNTVAISAQKVSGNSAILLKATKHISSVVSNINQDISQEAIDAEKCLVQMESLSKQINQVNAETSKMNEIANDNKEIVDLGKDLVEELNIKSKATSNIVKTIKDDIQRLDTEILSINNMIGAINDIAEQTNLLSLNASIEAARAGVSGKGFAVVADEIRKLAEQSANASNQIYHIISNIQEYTKVTVTTAEKADEILEFQENALTRTTQVFHDINHHVEKLTQGLDGITSEISSIDSAKHDTLIAIESISAIAEETAAASLELESTADNQLIAVQELSDAADGLKKESHNLEETIKLFKII